MYLIETGAELWKSLTEMAGLDLENYDFAIEDDFRKFLHLSKGSLVQQELQNKNIAVEAVLNAFFKSLQPFVAIYSDILILIESAAKAKAKENLLIRFDFNNDEAFEVNLNNFRQDIESLRETTQPVLVSKWKLDDLWDLSNLLNPENNNFESDELKEWKESYIPLQNIWPDTMPALPVTGETQLDQYFARIWQIVDSFLSLSRESSFLWNNIQNYNQAEIHLEGFIPFNGNKQLSSTLRDLNDDFLAYFIMKHCYMVANEVQENAPLAQKVSDDLGNFLDNIPVEKRDLKLVLEEFESALSLPIWKRRHELYSIWVLCQIVNTLKIIGRQDDVQFLLQGDVFHIPFSPTQVAVKKDLIPNLFVWSEVRSPVFQPQGRGRNENIQPDYCLTLSNNKPPFETLVVVECKQYLREASGSFSDAIIDYACGHPNALIVLVNYGPAGQNTMNKIDELICKRTLVVGNFRPGQNIKLSEFRNRLTDLILKHTELDPGDPRVIKAEWSLELTWTFHESDPYDFDLSLVPPKLAKVPTIDYKTLGAIDQFPWIVLNNDDRNGQTSEIIRVLNATYGKYMVLVHVYKYPLTVPFLLGMPEVVIKTDEEVFTFSLPNGEGDWWYVCDVDFIHNHVDVINRLEHSKPLPNA